MMTHPRHIARQHAMGQKSESALGGHLLGDTHLPAVPQPAERGDQNVADDHDSAVAPPPTPSAKQAKPPSSPDHLDIDDAGGYALTPRRKQPNARRELAPGYAWNSSTQELIPILPEDHPDHLENAETIRAAFRRWGQGTPK
jgi:hypothetical protein